MSSQQQHVAHQSHQQRLAARSQQRKVRKPKRPRAAVVATATSAAPVRSEPEFLEGLVIEGDLFLLDPATRTVYSSERDDDENLVPAGTWADGKLTPLPAAPAPAAPPPSAAPAAAPASVPHPVPQPLVFEATEEDHCETPPEAYAHIAPLLRLVARALGREPAELRVYDPYFCNGAVARHLAALGFPLVHNRNEDFYALLEAGRLPAHDVVVTNPNHFAVALEYKPETMSVPIVVAKGVDTVALRIRNIAEENYIPVVENPPVAMVVMAWAMASNPFSPVNHSRAAQAAVSAR